MPSPFITPNMGLTEPTVGGTISPTWAMLLNIDLSIIDQHNHTPGFGVPITPAGLNINTDLTFQGNSATHLNTLIFSGAVTGSLTPLTIYTDGTDLWFEDVNGNTIQLTKAGSPNAGTGNIQGLPSTPTGGAGISWVNPSGTFQSLTDAGTVGANIDAGTYILRYPGSYPAPTGNAVVLRAPSSISGIVPITFPATLPGATSYVTMLSSGALAVTSPVVSSNKQVSSSSSIFITSSTSFVPVTNLSVTITTTGNPVDIIFIPDPAFASSSIQTTSSTADQANSTFAIDRDSATVVWASTIETQANVGTIANLVLPPGTLNMTDYSVSAGTHTYFLKVKSGNSAYSSRVTGVILVAIERK